MKLKKIILFYPSFEKGGVENILVNFIKFLLRKKLKVVLISSNFNRLEIINKKLFSYKYFKFKNSYIPNRFSAAYIGSKLLVNELKKSKKEDTVVFSLQSSSLSILITRILGFKIVARNAEDPIYSTIHADKKILAVFVIFFKILTYNFASGIITNSNGSKISMNKLVFNKKKIISIYNPYLKKNLKIKNNKKRNWILSVGRLTKQKDFNTLINAFSMIHNEIPNFKLLIIGSGEKQNELKKNIINLKLEKKIKIKSWTKNLNQYYSKSKIFILSSIYEGLGNVLIDAANYKLPIIATKCKSGPSEIIDYGKGGYLVPVSNKFLLAKKITHVLNNYKKAIEKAQFAKKRVSRFYIEKNSLLYLKYIKKVFYE